MIIIDLLQQSQRKKRLVEQHTQPAVLWQFIVWLCKSVLGKRQERGRIVEETPAFAHDCRHDQPDIEIFVAEIVSSG